MVEERRMMVRVKQVMQTAHRQDTYLKWVFQLYPENFELSERGTYFL